MKQKHRAMNEKQFTQEIKTFAENENISFIEACQAFQAAALKMGNEKMIEVIHKIKMKSIE